jgi:hypothetical protein
MATRRRCTIGLALVAVALSLTACGSVDNGRFAAPHAGARGLPEKPGSKQAGKKVDDPSWYLSYEPPLLPITLSIDSNFQVSASVQAGKLLTPLGSVAVGGSTGSEPQNVPAAASGTVQILVCFDGVPSPPPCRAFRINTGRKLSFVVNLPGNVHQLPVIGQDRTVILKVPVGSTVTVTDVDGPPAKDGIHPAAYVDVEEYDFSERGTDTEVSLEAARGGVPDIGYDHISGELKPLNGARVAHIKRYGNPDPGVLGPQQTVNFTGKLPGEKDCATEGDWKSALSHDDLKADTIVACVKTAEGDYARLVLGRNRSATPVAYHVYSYTWIRSRLG